MYCPAQFWGNPGAGLLGDSGLRSLRRLQSSCPRGLCHLKAGLGLESRPQGAPCHAADWRPQFLASWSSPQGCLHVHTPWQLSSPAWGIQGRARRKPPCLLWHTMWRHTPSLLSYSVHLKQIIKSGHALGEENQFYPLKECQESAGLFVDTIITMKGFWHFIKCLSGAGTEKLRMGRTELAKLSRTICGIRASGWCAHVGDRRGQGGSPRLQMHQSVFLFTLQPPTWYQSYASWQKLM